MPQSLVQIYVHLVFSTKERRPFLQTMEHRQRMHAYLAGSCNKMDSHALVVGGVEDHVHLLCRLGKTIDIASLVREMKKTSSAWAKSDLGLSRFGWQSGYGAFSISNGHIARVDQYIQNQEEHHQAVTFKDEFRRICRLYAVELDERYVWD